MMNTVIAEFEFNFRNDLRTINIPDDVTEIGGSAYLFCENLSEVNFPASLKVIGRSAFCGCWRLKEISLPAKLVEIGANAFINCSSLRKVTLPNGLLKIGDCAFKGCEILREIKIPASVVEIGKDVFAGCESLKKIYCRTGSNFAEKLCGGNSAELITFDAPKENFSWQIDGDTLTVGGTDAAKKIFCDENAPWFDKRKSIRKIIIKS